MKKKYTLPTKTMGPQAARFVMGLHERQRLFFTLKEAVALTGLKTVSARSFVRKLVNRGIVTRLKPGLYNLVPMELGQTREHLGNPYLVARELAGERSITFHTLPPWISMG